MPDPTAANLNLESSIILSTTRGDGDIHAKIPHYRVTALIGVSDSNKNYWFTGALKAESERLLSAGKIFSEKHRPLVRGRPWNKISRLHPVINITDALSDFQNNCSLLDVLGISRNLASLLFNLSVPTNCPECGENLVGVSVESNIRTFKEKNKKLDKTQLNPWYIAAVFTKRWISQLGLDDKNKNEDLKIFFKEIFKKGFYRFIILGKLHLFKADDKAENLAKLENALNAYFKTKIEDRGEIFVVVDSIGSDETSPTRFMEASDLAQSLGSNLAAFIDSNMLSMDIGRDAVFVSNYGHYCINCHYLLPSLSSEIFLTALKTAPCSVTPDIGLICQIGDLSLCEIIKLPVSNFLHVLEQAVKLYYKESPHQAKEALSLWKEISSRLDYFRKAGLFAYELSFPFHALSFGEQVKALLCSYLADSLCELMFICDEILGTIHPETIDDIFILFRQLCENLNTILVLGNNRKVLELSDYLICLGEADKSETINITYSGSPKDWKQVEIAIDRDTSRDSLENKQVRKVTSNDKRTDRSLSVVLSSSSGAIELDVPLYSLVVVTGESGSGKSLFLKGVVDALNKRKTGSIVKVNSGVEKIKSASYLSSVSDIVARAAAISAKEMKTIAQVLGLDTEIDECFVRQAAARQAGLLKGAFTLKRTGERCRTCNGIGRELLDFDLLGFSEEKCSDCLGHRFSRKALSVSFREKNIADVYGFSVTEAQSFFSSEPKVIEKLRPLFELSLFNIRLGDYLEELSPNASFGVHLAEALGRSPAKNRLICIDGGLFGLPKKELEIYIKTLKNFILEGGSVFIVGFELELLQASDYLIEFSPCEIVGFSGHFSGLNRDSYLNALDFAK